MENNISNPSMNEIEKMVDNNQFYQGFKDASYWVGFATALNIPGLTSDNITQIILNKMVIDANEGKNECSTEETTPVDL